MAKTTKDSIDFKDSARRTTRLVGVSSRVLGRRSRRVLYADLGDRPAADPCHGVACTECPVACPHGGVL